MRGNLEVLDRTSQSRGYRDKIKPLVIRTSIILVRMANAICHKVAISVRTPRCRLARTMEAARLDADAAA